MVSRFWSQYSHQERLWVCDLSGVGVVHRYKCAHCEKTFANSSNRNIHEKWCLVRESGQEASRAGYVASAPSPMATQLQHAAYAAQQGMGRPPMTLQAAAAAIPAPTPYGGASTAAPSDTVYVDVKAHGVRATVHTSTQAMGQVAPIGDVGEFLRVQQPSRVCRSVGTQTL